MKYVSTKDGHVYIRNKENDDTEFIGVEPTKHEPNLQAINKNIVIKEADTIEELCDGWVAVNKETKKAEVLFPLSRWNYIEAKEHAEYEESDLYGVIWIKGEHDEPILKPAAKMNKDGVLELI